MLKDKALSFSIICLSAAIVVSALIIGDAMEKSSQGMSSGLSSISSGVTYVGGAIRSMDDTESMVLNRHTYSLSTAAEYLGIKKDELLRIIAAEESGIPYVKVGSEYIFSKGSLEKWLETVRVEVE